MPTMGYSGIWGGWFNRLSPPPSLLIPQVEPDENPSSELLERREGMTGEQILRCWDEEQHWDGAVSPGGLCLSCPLLMEKWRTSHPGRAWARLSAHSPGFCLSSGPPAFVPVFRTPDGAHPPLVKIKEPPCAFPVPAAPSQRELIPAMPSQTDGAHPASPRSIPCGGVKSECFLQTQGLFRDENSPPAPSLPTCLWGCLKIALSI